jgi:hypothetical protein
MKNVKIRINKNLTLTGIFNCSNSQKRACTVGRAMIIYFEKMKWVTDLYVLKRHLNSI